MRTKTIKGMGIQGIQLTLGCGDMFAAEQMKKMLDAVIYSQESQELYDKTPYDERKSAWPNGKPELKHMPLEALKKLRNLMNKMACTSSHITLFEEEDEKDDKTVEDDDE